MKIFFMRHGETDYNKKMIMQGALDTDLNDIGKSQAKIASEEVSKLNVDIIICSPQKRALETAKIIAKKINKEVIVDERLRAVTSAISSCGESLSVAYAFCRLTLKAP